MTCVRFFTLVVTMISLCPAATAQQSMRPDHDTRNSGFRVLDQVEFDRQWGTTPVSHALQLYPNLPTNDTGKTELLISNFGDDYFQYEDAAEKDIASVRRRLGQLERTPLFGCFDRNRIPEMTVEHVCRFTRKVDLSNGRFVSSRENTPWTAMSKRQKAVFDRARSLRDDELDAFYKSSDMAVWRELYWKKIIRQTDGSELVTNYRPDFTFEVDASTGGTISFPFDWYQKLEHSHLSSVWLECSIRADADGFPITGPDDVCRPIGLEADGMLLLSVQRKQPGDGGGSYVRRYHGKAFDLGRTVDPLQAARTIMNVFVPMIKARMEGEPVLATQDISQPMAPRELLFRRDFELSRILSTGFAGPYFERSAYVFQWWCGEVYPGGDLDPISGCNTPFASIVITMAQSTQISSSLSGDYPDATPRQDAVYRDVIQRLISETILKTTQQLGGTMRDNVGIFVGEVQ